MSKSNLLWVWVPVILVISFFTSNLFQLTEGQVNISPSSSNKARSSSITSSITMDLSNDTLKSKTSMLWEAVVGFLKSGPNLLKTSASDPIVKTKITNKINNDSQSVEGVEATNAILSVEITKALRSVNSSSFVAKQTGIVTIETTSLCKPSDVKSISCQNNVVIK